MPFDIWHMTSYIWQLTSDIWQMTTDIWQLTDDNWPMTADIWLLTSNSWYLWYMTSAIWCMTYCQPKAVRYWNKPAVTSVSPVLARTLARECYLRLFFQGGLKGMNCWVLFHVGKYQSVTINGQHNCADSKEDCPHSKNNLPPADWGGRKKNYTPRNLTSSCL